MPTQVLRKRSDYRSAFDSWVEQVVRVLEDHGRAIIAVREPVISDPGVSARIRNCIASLACEVYDRTQVKELMIEGGSTASVVFEQLGLSRLTPLHQFQQGVIRMKVENMEDLHMTLKPGSYIWPESIWNF
jgi:uncharacterized protein YgbK (DUF1537 family)